MLVDISKLEATRSLALRIAVLARPGDAILLAGPLGAGKTTFARYLLRALSKDDALDVPSPSFTLLQSYPTTKGFVHHIDLWRLGGPADLIELGWDDLTQDIVVVEWPDRLGYLQPNDALTITIAMRDVDQRVAELIGWADR